jgi:hypothetical protein
MERTCATCFYETGKKCKILYEKIKENCFAWADEAEAKRREKSIKEYNEPILPTAMTDEQKERKRKNTELNLKMRGGKSSFEMLDEHFEELYQQGMTDIEIGKRLYVDRNRVYDYRKSKNLPAWNKESRSLLTETA